VFCGLVRNMVEKRLCTVYRKSNVPDTMDTVDIVDIVDTMDGVDLVRGA
jgi:hypothetical protein